MYHKGQVTASHTRHPATQSSYPHRRGFSANLPWACDTAAHSAYYHERDMSAKRRTGILVPSP